MDFCPSGCGWVVVHRVVGDKLLSTGVRVGCCSLTYRCLCYRAALSWSVIPAAGEFFAKS